MISERDKSFSLLIILFCLSSGQMGLSLYLPSLPMIQSTWHIDTAQIQLTLSTYFLSFGITQLFYGTLSEHFGRRPLMLIGLLIGSMGALWASCSSSLDSLLIARFLQGAGTGAIPVLARTCVKDMFTGRRFNKAVSYLSMTSSTTLALAPFLGSWIAEYFGWRSEFVFLCIFTLVLLLISYKWLFETHRNRATKGQRLYVSHIIKQYLTLYKNISFLYYMALILCAYIILIACLENAPFFFEIDFHISMHATSYFMLSLPVAYLIGIFINHRLSFHLSRDQLLLLGMVLLCITGLAFIIQALLGMISLTSVVLAITLAGLTAAFFFVNATGGMLGTSENVGTAAAISGVSQMLGTSILTSFISFMHWNTIEGLGWVFLAILIVSMLLSLMMFFYRKQQGKLSY